MNDPTPEVIVHALKNAKDLILRNRKLSLATALARATTTPQCQGFPGFKVYEAVRVAVAESEGLNRVQCAEFTDTVFDIRAITALDKAIKELS